MLEAMATITESPVPAAAPSRADFAHDQAAYLTDKFQRPVFDPVTGMDSESLEEGVRAFVRSHADHAPPIIKARVFEYIARQVRIEVDPRDWFVAFGCWDRTKRPMRFVIHAAIEADDRAHPERAARIAQINRLGSNTIWRDFDHSVPDWPAIHALGFPGLRARAGEYRARHARAGTLTSEAAAYFDGLDITYAAIIEMLERFRRRALEGPRADARTRVVADALARLAVGPPRDFFEALTLVYLFFMFGEHIDHCQVRSLGNLDVELLPYYRRDLAEGRRTEEEMRVLLDYFLMQWASIDNYWGHPFYLGGAAEGGGTAYNEFSRIILEEYDRLALHTPKIQLKIVPDTPTERLDQAADMIRRGHSGLVFIGEAGMARMLAAAGYPAAETRSCAISGCYEFAPQGRANVTAAGHINLLKPLEWALNDGVDPLTGEAAGPRTGAAESFADFAALHAAYLVQLDAVIDESIALANDFERGLYKINPTSVYSATILNSLETGRDAFSHGCVYNHSMLLTTGFASAVDALAMVRRYVYEKRVLSLPALRDMLARDWSGEDDEAWRLRLRRDPNKYGNGLDEVDTPAAGLARHLAQKINGRPNGRGGHYLASGHCARQFIVQGEKTGATPDGRRAGEEMSKNLSPAQGADVNGVTALLATIARIDPAWFPGGHTLDVMLHPATVRGSEGLAALRAVVQTHVRLGGGAVHFNIFDAATLRDAQRRPERYRGLQVRVCGWNVLFNDLPAREQDAYIERAERIRE